jgi:hypothetical protein
VKQSWLTRLVPRRVTASEALTDYAQGPLAFIPAVVLLLLIRVYGALGGWQPGQVLALSLGMTASMLVCGGFVFAMSRRACICLAMGDRRGAAHFLHRTMVVAGVGVAAVALLVVLVTGALGLFTSEERVTFGLAFLGLSAIWIVASGLSLLRASAWLGFGLTAGLLAGVAVDCAVAAFSDLHLWAGTAVGFALAMGVVLRGLAGALGNGRSGQHPRRVVLPPSAYLIYEAAPYFMYGALYAVLPFLAHPLGWFGALAAGEERQWAVINIEAGLTLSLPPLILGSGVIERTLRQFWTRAVAAQNNTPGNAQPQFGGLLQEFYQWHLRRYLIVLGTLSGVAFGLFRLALGTGLLARWLGFDALNLVEGLFLVSLVSYWFLGWGLFNCMFPITLSRPRLATQAVAPAIAVTILAGLPLSLGLHFTYAGGALLLGSVAYVAASSRATRHVLESAPYYYYSAY